MAVHKKLTPKHRRGNRCSHDGLKVTQVVEDKNTEETKRSHHMTNSGFYRGIQMLVKKSKLEE